MRISSFALLFFEFFTAINLANFTKEQLHLHVEYINRNEACMTCWPKNRSDGDHGTYFLYNQSNLDKTIDHEDRAQNLCNKSLSSQSKTAYLSVQQEVTVVCGEHGNLGEKSINVTLFPLSSDDEDSISSTTGIDSDMLLKCNSMLGHNVSCWKLSLIHVSKEDAYCNASNNFFGIISIFPPSLYRDIELEDVPILLRALETGYNFSESENSCVKVTGSVLQYSDIALSVTPEPTCPQTPRVEPVTDALNQIIEDKPTYVLASFPVVVVMFVLLVLATAIILILAICYCKQKRYIQQYILQNKDPNENTPHGWYTPENDNVTISDRDTSM